MNRQLKARIIERFGSQAEFSVVVDRPEAFVSRVLHGYRKLTPEEMDRWSKVLEDHPQRLFGGATGQK